MHWYKKAQTIVPEELAKDTSYIDIGHGLNNKNLTKENVFLWIWKNNQIETRKATYGSRHLDIWGLDSFINNYSGRYEDFYGTKRVSIKVPFKRRFYELPKKLLYDLKNQFGEDIEVYIYNDK